MSTRIGQMWRIVKAEIRQWFPAQIWTLVVGLSLVALAYGIERDGSPYGRESLTEREVRQWFIWLFMCAGPVVAGWYLNLYGRMGVSYRLIHTLPLPRSQINLARVLLLISQFVSVIVVWGGHYVLAAHFGRPFTMWVPVVLFCYLMLFLILALRHSAFWIAQVVLVAALGISNALEKGGWLTFPSMPFHPVVALLLATLAIGVSWWAVRTSPPIEPR